MGGVSGALSRPAEQLSADGSAGKTIVVFSCLPTQRPQAPADSFKSTVTEQITSALREFQKDKNGVKVE